MTSSRVENSSGRAAQDEARIDGACVHCCHWIYRSGNFATNIQAGASFGYQLLWVVVWANLMAMLIQVLSAKLGIATGKTGGTDSRSLSASGGVVLLGAGGNYRHGYRPRRIYWGGHWL